GQPEILRGLQHAGVQPFDVVDLDRVDHEGRRPCGSPLLVSAGRSLPVPGALRAARQPAQQDEADHQGGQRQDQGDQADHLCPRHGVNIPLAPPPARAGQSRTLTHHARAAPTPPAPHAAAHPHPPRPGRTHPAHTACARAPSPHPPGRVLPPPAPPARACPSPTRPPHSRAPPPPPAPHAGAPPHPPRPGRTYPARAACASAPSPTTSGSAPGSTPSPIAHLL